MDASVILEWLTGVSGTLVALATFVLAFFTWRAVREAEHSRQIAADSLAELRSEHNARYETYVVPVLWKFSNDLDVVNLGPGPARNVRIRAVVQSRAVRRCFECTVPGLAPAETRTISMNEIVSTDPDNPPFPDLAKDISSDPVTNVLLEVLGHITVEITSSTVLGAKMPALREKVPEARVDIH